MHCELVPSINSFERGIGGCMIPGVAPRHRRYNLMRSGRLAPQLLCPIRRPGQINRGSGCADELEIPGESFDLIQSAQDAIPCPSEAFGRNSSAADGFRHKLPDEKGSTVTSRKGLKQALTLMLGYSEARGAGGCADLVGKRATEIRIAA